MSEVQQLNKEVLRGKVTTTHHSPNLQVVYVCVLVCIYVCVTHPVVPEFRDRLNESINASSNEECYVCPHIHLVCVSFACAQELHVRAVQSNSVSPCVLNFDV